MPPSTVQTGIARIDDCLATSPPGIDLASAARSTARSTRSEGGVSDTARGAPQQQQVSQQLALTLVTNARCTAAGPDAAAYVKLSLRTERGGVSGHTWRQA